jgi:hypothetical protein
VTDLCVGVTYYLGAMHGATFTGDQDCTLVYQFGSVIIDTITLTDTDSAEFDIDGGNLQSYLVVPVLATDTFTANVTCSSADPSVIAQVGRFRLNYYTSAP